MTQLLALKYDVMRKLDKLKRLVKQNEKENVLKSKRLDIENLQKAQTAKRYFRCRYFEIE